VKFCIKAFHLNVIKVTTQIFEILSEGMRYGCFSLLALGSRRTCWPALGHLYEETECKISALLLQSWGSRERWLTNKWRPSYLWIFTGKQKKGLVSSQRVVHRDGQWPDQTQAYFGPAVNKRPTRLWPGFFLTQPEEIFFEPKGKKLKNLALLVEIFQTQTINGWPNLTRPKPQKINSTWVKKFWPKPITMCIF